MADSLVTQVRQPTTKTPLRGNSGHVDSQPRGFFQSLFCCLTPGSRYGAPEQERVVPAQQAAQWPQFPDPGQNLLPPLAPSDSGRKCLVLDLDETLVHSSFQPVPNADFVVPIEIDGQIHHVYVLKRPHVDQFLQQLGELFEIVLFTASLSKYADPVCDLLDTHRVFRHRLFREHCVRHAGHFVKDLSRLGRDSNQVLIVDNSPFSYKFDPLSAIPVESWFDDRSDGELLELLPFFKALAASKDCTELDVKAQGTPLAAKIVRARAAVAAVMGNR